VLYRGNFHPGLGTDHRLVSGVEFLALLVPHVLLRFECVIRSYGTASTTTRRRLGWIKKKAETMPPPAVAVIAGEESAFVRLRKKNWSRLIAKVWFEDPTLCKRCGKEMKVVAAISSPAQDAVIEKLLRARNEWDPPWLRSRPPRGPPADEDWSGERTTASSSRREAIEPEPWTDETWVDPPHPED